MAKETYFLHNRPTYMTKETYFLDLTSCTQAVGTNLRYAEVSKETYYKAKETY